MNRTNLIKGAFLSLILYSATSATSAADESPTFIPFQGRLTDQNGQAYSTGQFTVTFNLYDQAIGGTSVWTERHEKVSVINGMINAFLGSVNGIDGVDFSGTKFLGIAVDADDNPSTPEPEMVPRTMIIPAFFAKKAEDSAQLNGAGWDAVLTEGDANSATAVLRSEKIGAGAITEAKLADDAVTAGKIATDAVTSNEIAAGAVTTVELADGSISGDDLLDGTVTNDDLGAGAASSNLADEGLIALGAYPIRVSGAINLDFNQGIAPGLNEVYAVPADSYARLYIAEREMTQNYMTLRVAGRDIQDGPSNSTSTKIQDYEEFLLGPGQKVEVQNFSGSSPNMQIYLRGIVFTSSAP